MARKSNFGRSSGSRHGGGGQSRRFRQSSDPVDGLLPYHLQERSERPQRSWGGNRHFYDPRRARWAITLLTIGVVLAVLYLLRG